MRSIDRRKSIGRQNSLEALDGHGLEKSVLNALKCHSVVAVFAQHLLEQSVFHRRIGCNRLFSSVVA